MGSKRCNESHIKRVMINIHWAHDLQILGAEFQWRKRWNRSRRIPDGDDGSLAADELKILLPAID